MRVLLSALLILFATVSLPGAVLAQQRMCEQLVFSADPNLKPWAWETEGRLQGAAIRIMRLAGELVGISAVAEFSGPAKRVMARLRSGEIDAAAALLKSEKVAGVAILSDFFAVDEIVLFKRRGSDLRYVKWDDLDGLRVATTAGDARGEALDGFLEQTTRMTRVTDLENVFRLVKYGRVDVGVHRYYPVLLGLSGSAYGEELVMLHNHVAIALLHIGFSHKSPCKALQPRFNESLRQLRRDGTISRIVQEELERVRQIR